MGKRATILVVDDEPGVRESFNMVLKDRYNVLLTETGKEAMDVFTRNAVDLILLDIVLPDLNGIELLEKFRSTDPNTEIIMVTAVKEVQTAVTAIKLGAYEYILKPFVVEEVLNTVHRALEKRSLMKEVTYLRNELERYHPFERIVGENDAMKQVFDLISSIAESDGSVLIQGESGTGKELVAREIHGLSPRSNEPFVVVNCAAIPQTLMESTFFGHHKGAFTGADRTKTGKLEIAHGGTVFLDDIDVLDVSMQAKFLRAIQEKEFEKLGSNKVIKVDVRFIAASNRNLKKLLGTGEFREDLFYRLSVFPVKLPPLRERRSDVPLLVNHFLELNAKKSGKPPKRFSENAIKRLVEYDWPGNVRELQNLVERSFAISKEPIIRLKDISLLSVVQRKDSRMTLREAVGGFEKSFISEVLERVAGNRKSTAEILGIHRNTLLAKMNEYGIK